MKSSRLPVEDILDTLRQQLLESDAVVLEAPPGAGKTTLVPLSLMHEPWLAGKKILMLEPRRIAAKSAAYRMASLIREHPGQTVGYRMRMDSKIGRDTKIEIITEGILTRMLQQDPSLDDVGLVIFDEFHERSLDSDLGLSLCLQGRALFGNEIGSGASRLKILVMSATLDSDAIAQMLGNAPIVKSEGRAFPVEIIYGSASRPGERIVDRVVSVIKQALAENPHCSLLAFLPGQGEIRRTTDELANWLESSQTEGVHLRPLYGDLTIEDQQQAIAALTGDESGHRKVVLATNIAETSLTIEGVDVVVDSGLVREAKFDPGTGMTGLQTVKISIASSVQRMGRAGRLRPGKCYRLWTAEQQQKLAPQGTAEILQADLAPLAMQLLQWGVNDPGELSWLDPPPTGPWQQAMDLLGSLGAITTKGGATIFTEHGQAMAILPVHPRLAQLLICGAKAGFTDTATLLAALLSDRDPFPRDEPDIGYRLDILSGESQCPTRYQGWMRRTRQLARQFEALLAKLDIGEKRPRNSISSDHACGYLLACAYPDRIARRRQSGGYQLANGRSAGLAGEHHPGNSPWLSVAEVSRVAGRREDSIRSAIALDESLFSGLLLDFVRVETIVEWDNKANRFVAEEQQKIGALLLTRTSINPVPAAARTSALIRQVRQQGLQLLPWNDEQHQWCARVNLLRSLEADENWPDVSRQTLLDTLEDWLAPYLDGVNSLQGFRKLDLSKILQALLPWEKRQQLNTLAPPRLKVASGSAIAIDYTQSPPVLAVKLQEMFGCEQSPTVVSGKVALLVHLLSPAGRPLQITQDLAGFWRSSYHQVKKEMKGRYPKHPWPDDPLSAKATRKTRARN